MMRASFNPEHTLGSYRKTDAVVIVYQDNSRKVIEIAAINAEAGRITGYDNAALVSKPLAFILPERINSVLQEFTNFSDEHNDLQAVLGKVRDFAIKSQNGQEVPYQLRIIRGEAIDRNPWFHLVFVDKEKQEKTNAFRSILKENFKGHEVIDERSGLPTRGSLFKDMELVVYHVINKEISAAFAMVDINNYERLIKEFGQSICDKLLHHIGQICRLKLRPEDTVGMVSDRTVGIILMDATQDAARVVLNRLRWVISVTPLELPDKKELLAQVNINFTPIDGKANEMEVIETCEAFSKGLRGTVNNSVQLTVVKERREKSEERRKASIAVEKERRKKERRHEKE